MSECNRYIIYNYIIGKMRYLEHVLYNIDMADESWRPGNILSN